MASVAIPFQGASKPGHDNRVAAKISTSVGGSIYATTPGGTVLKYSKDFLMKMRESPLSKSPAIKLPTIPGVTAEMEATAMAEEAPRPRDRQMSRGSADDSSESEGNAGVFDLE
eukprot:tig00001042_g6599.t1